MTTISYKNTFEVLPESNFFNHPLLISKEMFNVNGFTIWIETWLYLFIYLFIYYFSDNILAILKKVFEKVLKRKQAIYKVNDSTSS